MKVLVVYAHPEPGSFCRALLERGVAELETSGHEVVVSDLYAAGFAPVAGPADFAERRFPERLQYDREQKYNHGRNGLSADIAGEIDKVVGCDCLILHFPLWWFGLPAILKGWVDRVFVNGVAYGAGRRFDTGGFAGKRAMLVTTTAAREEMCGPDGLLGALDVILWPIQNGTLAYAGFQVLPPFVAWSAVFVDDATRAGYLEAFAARMRQLETTAPLPFHSLADFGPNWRLKPGIVPRAAGQRAGLDPAVTSASRPPPA